MQNITETKTCKHCSVLFDIYEEDMAFYDKISPVFGGVKYSIPTPKLCPDCRQQRRLAWRNERKLYRRTCDLTGKNIISTYKPGSSYKIYDKKDFFSDMWNPIDYGQDFDFSKSFFQQFDELMHKVPRMSLVGQDWENSDYVNQCIGVKNCYLMFRSTMSENCLYGRGIFNSEDVVDGLDSIDCHNVYCVINSYGITNSKYIVNSSQLLNCAYMFDCHNCTDCMFCHNLHNKQYMIENIQYTKDQYFEMIKTIPYLSFKDMYNKYANKYIVKNVNIQNSQLCQGSDIENSNHSHGYVLNGCNNCVYCSDLIKTNDAYDCCFNGGNRSLDYECVATGKDGQHLLFSYNTTAASHSLYLQECFDNCQDCFGCISLRNKQYCILNKQYSKEEYENLVPKIIEHMKQTGEWGEFFNQKISPFGYNETIAIEYYPLTKESASMLGYNWSDYEAPFPQMSGIIQSNELPLHISEIDDTILNKAIACEDTGKLFRIVGPELEFYRKHSIPLPRKHPDQRHLERMQSRPQRKYWSRSCMKCGIPFETVYAPSRSEIVYCESCYNKEIY